MSMPSPKTVNLTWFLDSLADILGVLSLPPPTLPLMMVISLHFTMAGMNTTLLSPT